MKKVKWCYLLPLAIILLAGCRDEYQEARNKCADDHSLTVDYIQCVNKINAQEESDSADAAMVASQTALMSAAATVQ